MAPRQTVSDLRPAPPIEPVARGIDSYARPGETQIGPPAHTNSMMQLSAALSHFEPRLLAYQGMVAQQNSEADLATARQELDKARAAHDVTRGSFNSLIGTGKILPGQSPFVNRLADRLQLQQLGHQYSNEYFSAFHTSEDFAQARASNNPEALTAATNKFHKTFMDANGFGASDAISRIGDPYNRLDVQEVLTPMINKSGNQVLQAWTQHRITERGKDAVAAVGGSMSTALQELSLRAPQHEEDGGANSYSRVGTHINALIQEGVNNGAMGYTDGNKLAVDTVVAHIERSGDTSLKNVLMHVSTNNGKSSVGATPYAVARIQAAEEAVISYQHKLETIQEHRDNKQFRADSKEHTIKSWKWADQAHEMSLQNFARTNAAADRAEVMRTGEIAAYAAADNGDHDAVERVMNGLRQVDRGAANAVEKGMGDLLNERYKMLVPPSAKNDLSVANYSAAIQADPMNFSRRTLISAMRRHEISGAQEESLAAKLVSAQQRGGHEYMQHQDYRDAIAAIKHVVGKDPYDAANALAQLEVPHALYDLNIAAREFIDKNPQATQSQFQKYIKEQVTPIAQAHNEVVKEQVADRDKSLKEATEKQKAADDQAKKDFEAKQAKAETAEQVKKAVAGEAEMKAKDKSERTDEGRLIIHLPDGSIETEKSITFQDVHNANRWVNFPTIFSGKHVSEEQAIRIFHDNDGTDPDTGRKVKYYYTLKDAEIAARERSAMLGKKYAGHKPAGPAEKQWPKPEQFHYRALREDPSEENIAAFRKHFGPKSLSENYGQLK